MRSAFSLAAAASLLASQTVGAIDLNVNDQQSIKDAAKTIAKDTWSYYKGDTDSSRLGLLEDGVYWWEAGAMFGSMISYSYMTGDTQFDSDVAKAIYSQVSPTKDFMMTATQLGNLGNDDQAFWALTAMSAAEHKLPVPDGAPSDIWLTAASGAFNDLIGRWNTTFCGGGIKWQFVVANNGFNYKSSIANGATMQLGARLALLTGNQTYADKATQVWDWMKAIGYISDSYQVYDGAGDDPDNCTKIDLHEWSYNSAALLGGAAAMANYTAKTGNSDLSSTWTDRTKGLWQHATDNFFKDNVLYEQPCEDVGSCDTDQKSFKAYMSRWATFAGQIVPGIMSDVQSKLQSTASAVAKSCTGNGGTACGMKWYNNAYDGETGVGQEMSALEAVVCLLGPNVPFVAGMGSSSSASGSTSSSSSVASAVSTTMATSVVHSTSAPAPTGTAAASSPAGQVAVATNAADNGANIASHASSAATPAATPAGQPCLQNDKGVPYMTAAVA